MNAAPRRRFRRFQPQGTFHVPFFAFLHRPTDFRDRAFGPADDCRLYRPARAADLGISGDRPANCQHHCRLSRRIGRGHRLDRGDPDRAGGEWRRQHALHQLAVDRGWPGDDQRRLQARHQHRSGAGARAEPRRGRRATSAGRRAPPWRSGAQGLAGPDDGHPYALAGWLARPAVHFQLHDALREGCADPRGWCRQCRRLRRARLFDAHLARSRACRLTQSDSR